ncbi:RICIN domain-containing protein [Kitasatospora sp. NPDC051853]|uniref:RICIN domain-containing protein n=1 Tax=Kitasatospora sp. NPDC051853 TaxID=3364058 RepID=UPI00378B46F6
MTVIREGLHHLRSAADGRLLTVADERRRSGAGLCTAEPDGSPGQLWRISAVHPGGGLYHLTSEGSGRRLDVAGARTEDGVPVQLWTPNGFGAQDWLLERHVDAPDTFNLVALISGRSLEIGPDGTARQWEDRDDPSQWWHLDAV